MRMIVALLAHWLNKNGLKHEGVELVLRFPTPRERDAADNTLKAESHPSDTTLLPTGGLKIDGFPIRFEAKPWGHE